jgi:hypothetical protein
MRQRWSGRAPETRVDSAYGSSIRIVSGVLTTERALSRAEAAAALSRLANEQYRIARLQLIVDGGTFIHQRVSARRPGVHIAELYIEAPALLPSFEPA